MDVRYALRSLRKDPGFTVLAVLIMALGIGANTAVFSVVNAVMLRPLAYRDAGRIVTLESLWKNEGAQGQISAPDFHDWHDQSTSFAAMAYYDDASTPVNAGGSAEFTSIAEVTPEFFDVFSVQPAAGRNFTPKEWKSGSGAVVSYAYWQSRLGGGVRALGQSLRMFDRSFDIVGVMPPGFSFPEKTAVWLPANSVFPETSSRSGHNYLGIGRLKPWVSLQQAQAEMIGIGSRLERQYPESNQYKSVAVTPMREHMVGNIRLTLLLLLGAVGLILLIACANMANLLLAKASARGREMAIRAAVGASRLRIVRQLITESALLATISGAVGVLLALWGTAALVALAPGNVPRLEETSVDGRVLAFTLGISLLASLIFGLAPALQASRVDLSDSLKQGSNRAGVSGGTRRLRSILVVAEISLSVVLLAGAGLLLRSFQALLSVPLGFRPDHVLVMETSVPSSDLQGRRRAARIYQQVLADAGSLPGVLSAGLVRTPPGRVTSNGAYYLDHKPETYSVNAPQAVFSVVSGGAFQTLGIPLRAGRDFSDSDSFNVPFTAIVNESLAHKSFPGQDPRGRTIFCGFDSPDTPMTIVGVVGDIRQFGPAESAWPEIYMPYSQHPMPGMRLLTRTGGDPRALSETLRQKMQARSPDSPAKFSTLEDQLSANVAAPRFRTLLLTAFALVAVLLAMAGVYGVMAYVVGQRAGEIGLRMALGAGSGDVVQLVLRQVLPLIGMGVGIGLAAAMATSTLLRSVLFEIKTTDPLTYAGVAAVLAVAALGASLVPARRAVRLDPLETLRQE